MLSPGGALPPLRSFAADDYSETALAPTRRESGQIRPVVTAWQE